MIDPIAAVGAAHDLAATRLTNASSNVNDGVTHFMDRLDRQLDGVNTQVNAADTQVRNLALGETDNVQGVFIALETARVSMGEMVQVRNRLVDAYQDLMRMQI